MINVAEYLSYKKKPAWRVPIGIPNKRLPDTRTAYTAVLSSRAHSSCIFFPILSGFVFFFIFFFFLQRRSEFTINKIKNTFVD